MDSNDKHLLGIVSVTITAVMVIAIVVLCFQASGEHQGLSQPEFDGANSPLVQTN